MILTGKSAWDNERLDSCIFSLSGQTTIEFSSQSIFTTPSRLLSLAKPIVLPPALIPSLQVRKIDQQQPPLTINIRPTKSPPKPHLHPNIRHLTTFHQIFSHLSSPSIHSNSVRNTALKNSIYRPCPRPRFPGFRVGSLPPTHPSHPSHPSHGVIFVRNAPLCHPLPSLYSSLSKNSGEFQTLPLLSNIHPHG